DLLIMPGLRYALGDASTTLLQPRPSIAASGVPFGPSSGGTYATITETVGGALVYASGDGSTSVPLWRSDGTDAGTFQLRDVAANSGPFCAATTGGATFLWRSDQALWKTTGSTLTKVKDFASTQPTCPTVLGSQVLFRFPGQLWRSNGTAA